MDQLASLLITKSQESDLKTIEWNHDLEIHQSQAEDFLQQILKNESKLQSITMNGVFPSREKRREVREQAAFCNARNNASVEVVLFQPEFDGDRSEDHDETNEMEDEEAISSGDDLIEGEAEDGRYTLELIKEMYAEQLRKSLLPPPMSQEEVDERRRRDQELADRIKKAQEEAARLEEEREERRLAEAERKEAEYLNNLITLQEEKNKIKPEKTGAAKMLESLGDIFTLGLNRDKE